jgi:fucose permease
MTDLRDDPRQHLLGGHPADDFSQVDSAQAASEEGTDKLRSLIRIVGCCISAASSGWHDGCLGALIPYLQLYYGVNDEKVSLVFIGSFTGYILASLLNVTLSNRITIGHLIISGASIQGLASLIIAFHPPFIAVAMSYAVAGFGLAIQDAQFNTYVARLPDAATKLGIVHAIYGVGALMSPTLATLLMHAKVSPPHFYFTNLAWCIVTMSVLSMGFESGSSSSDARSLSTEEDDARVTPLKTVISARAVWAALIFISLYTGAEIGEAGWVVSFLMRERDGGSMSGYASAAFYAGLTSSRVMLLPLTAYLTEKRAVALYCGMALALQAIVWATQLFIVDFIAIAVCGFVMGPVYPVTVSLVTKATPHGYHPGALSLMACFGQSGSALFPFVVGSLSEIYGIKVLQPVLVTLFIVMSLLWQLVPSPNVGLRQCSIGADSESVEEDINPTIHHNST